jgi:hypothetical protein
MNNKKLYVGTIGLNIKIEAGLDITTATLIEIRYTAPDGTLGTFNAVYEFEGGKHYGVYTTTSASDIDQEGRYIFQLYVEIGSNIFYGTEVRSDKFYTPMPTTS